MNRVFLLPTSETLDVLGQVFHGVNVQVNWDAICVEIGSSEKEVITIPNAEYQAFTGPMDIYYDSLYGINNLLLQLYPSPELSRRNQEIGDAWSRMFVPYLSMSKEIVLRRNRRALINSISDRFVNNPMLLTFHNETLVCDDRELPMNYDFYRDFLDKGAVPEKLYQQVATDAGY